MVFKMFLVFPWISDSTPRISRPLITIKGTKDPNQISLGEDEEMHALSYYIYQEHREGSSLKNSL